MKHLVWITSFIFLFFVGDRVGGFLLSKLTNASEFRYSRLYNQKAEADVLLVGNSRGLIFYQPYIEEKTGKSTLNISYNGLPIHLAQVLVEDYLDSYKAPEKIILDVTMIDRENDALINGFYLYAPYSERLQQLLLKTDKTSFYASKLTHLFRYNSEVFQRALFYLNKGDEDWLIDRVINQELINQVASADSMNFELPTGGLEALTGIVAAAKAHDVKIELVVNPYYPPFLQHFYQFEAWKNKIEVATGIPIRDYSSSVQEPEGFGDYQHLNKHGARMYIDLLLRDGVL